LQAVLHLGHSDEMILADFMVGAHAAVAGCPLLTRDRRRYAAYFPSLALVMPESRAG